MSRKARTRALQWRSFGGWVLTALGVLVLLAAGGPAGARSGPTEVRRLGVSRTGDTTLLTVLLSAPAEARITPKTEGGKAVLVVEFPRAQGVRLSPRLGGDDLLVQAVQTETTAAGVRITLEIAPNRTYTYWKKTKTLGSGQVAYLVGLKGEAGSAAPPPPTQAQMLPPATAQPSGGEPEQQYSQNREEYPVRGGASASGGRLGELKSLIPRAQPLWQFLEAGGWNVSQTQNYDRPGQRYTKGFYLTNSQYPEAVIKVAFLPANTPGAPNIGMVTLAFDKLTGPTADKYRQLRQMNFSQIRGKYEDIGDFFDDALKPLRVELRKQCQALANRWASFLQGYLKAASPNNPKVPEQAMAHIREKVNIRFEGVQHTISEDPLMLLNLVDFLYIRSYYLSTGGGS
jgi:hypothetical protein